MKICLQRGPPLYSTTSKEQVPASFQNSSLWSVFIVYARAEEKNIFRTRITKTTEQGKRDCNASKEIFFAFTTDTTQSIEFFVISPCPTCNAVLLPRDVNCIFSLSLEGIWFSYAKKPSQRGIKHFPPTLEEEIYWVKPWENTSQLFSIPPKDFSSPVHALLNKLQSWCVRILYFFMCHLSMWSGLWLTKKLKR